MDRNSTALPVRASLSLRRPKPAPEYRRQMSVEWKRSVIQALERNRRADVKPRNQAELAAAVDADKSMIGRMLWIPPLGDTSGRRQVMASALVPEICRVLSIPMPLIDATAPTTKQDPEPAPATPAHNGHATDELDEAIKWVPIDERARAAAVLRAMFGPIPRKSRDH